MTAGQCPHCGKQIFLTRGAMPFDLPAQPASSGTWRDFESAVNPLGWGTPATARAMGTGALRGTTIPPAGGLGYDLERREALRGQTHESDIMVPLNRAVISGGLAALLLSILWLVTLHEVGEGWQTYQASFFDWKWIPVVGALVVVSVWTGGVGHARELLWKVEKITSTPPAEPSEPNVHQTEIAVRLEQDGRKAQDLFLQFAEPFDLVVLLARSALADDALKDSKGGVLPESDWTGRGKPMSKTRLKVVKNTLIEAGLCAWRDPDHHDQGLELTRAGRHVLKSWLETHGANGGRRERNPIE